MKKLKLILFGASLFMLASCGSKAPDETESTPTAPAAVEQVEDTETDNTEAADTTDSESADGLDAALAKIEDLRNKAIESGAKDFAPGILDELDETLASIKERAAKGEDVTADLARLSMLYDALTSYSKACVLKNKIDDMELAQLDQKDYDAGVLYLNECDELFEEEELSAVKLQDASKKAYASLNTVYFVAFKKLAKDARAAAFEAKRDADSVKAGVSQKERYNEAVEIFKNGDSSYAMQNPERACDLYIEAGELFDELYEDVSEKRAAAQAAIDAAKAKVAESEKAALQADKDLPITDENLAGIEDEDAVLLEEDEYDDPEEAEADIAETFEEEVINTVVDYLEAK